jgi:hypothetical protein
MARRYIPGLGVIEDTTGAPKKTKKRPKSKRAKRKPAKRGRAAKKRIALSAAERRANALATLGRFERLTPGRTVYARGPNYTRRVATVIAPPLPGRDEVEIAFTDDGGRTRHISRVGLTPSPRVKRKAKRPSASAPKKRARASGTKRATSRRTGPKRGARGKVAPSRKR